MLRKRNLAAVAGVLLGMACCASSASAGAAKLKNGLIIEGAPVPIGGFTLRQVKQSQGGPTRHWPILMVDDDMRRYFVADGQVAGIDRTVELVGRFETFKLPQPRRGRQYAPTALGSVVVLEPFDEFGRRKVQILTAAGKVPVVQGVTRITPRSLTVEGITHDWKYGIAVSSVPPERLDAMLRTATEQDNAEDRMAIARFYLQAGLYQQASRELQSIGGDFPDYEKRVAEIDLELRQLQGRQVLAELDRRRAAGQHELAYNSAKKFPRDRMSAAVLRRVSELIREYDEAADSIERAKTLLGELQAQLDDPKKLADVMPMRSIVDDKLDFESLSRLDGFLKLSADESLSAGEKLALAYSGWILGGAHAVTDLELTIRLWEARFFILEYLRTLNELRRNELLAKLRRIEGLLPQHVVQIVRHLPPIIETPGLESGRTIAIEADTGSTEKTVKYAAVLPPEYNPRHNYPLIVALRPQERTIEQMAAWWAGTPERPGQAQRHGYIVIAPDYGVDEKSAYDYSPPSHAAVIAALRDARRRFSVDSGRVFLTGHGAGGDATFDIGMSHPDLFAGIIPICGVSDKFCKWYWQNCSHLPIYSVNGELARNSLEANSRDINRLMRRDRDVIYVEYTGRGYEGFYAEIHRLFDWMELQRRAKSLQEIDMRVLRPTDDRFYWAQASGFPPNVVDGPAAVMFEGPGGPPVRPMTLSVRVTPGNTIYVRSGAEHHTLWLSPEIVNFDKRVAVRQGGRQRFNDYLKFDLAALLEDLRLRGDRQKLYWARVEI